MKKLVVLFFFLFIIVIVSQISCVISLSNYTISDEIKKVSHYAEDYESGNINYAQLLIYLAVTKQNINDVLYDTYSQTGVPISKSEIETILGPSTGQTVEAWSGRQQKIITLDSPFSTWNKVIFDGRKIQLVVDVHPDLGFKDGKEFPGAIFEIKPVFKLESSGVSLSLLDDIIKQIGDYDMTLSDSLADQIAKKTTSFENSFRENIQQGTNCEKEMERLFGVESEGEKNEVNSYVISLNNNENQSMAFFQYCDKCESNGRIDIKFYRQTQGSEEQQKEIDKEQFRGLSDEQYRNEITNAFKEFIENSESNMDNKLNALANSWIESMYKGESEEARKSTYVNIRDFYINLFSSYSKQETKLYEREYKKELFVSNQSLILNIPEEDNKNISCNDYGIIKCDGKVISKGVDSNGCALEPVCILDSNKCSMNSDCDQPLCGISECVNGECRLNGLSECKKSECLDGDKDYMRCDSGEVLVRKFCDGGRWKETGQGCTQSVNNNQNNSQNNNQCNSIADCSNGQVCSLGSCVATPQNNEKTNVPIEDSENSNDVQKDDNGTALTGNAMKDEEKEKKEKEGKDYGPIGRVSLSGKCWVGNQDSGELYFQMEGKFGKIEDIRKQNMNQNNNNWCLADVKRAILERNAFESGMNNDFAKWFFEDYLANNANEWQRRSNTLQDLYNYDTKLSEIIAGSGECAGNYKAPEPRLVNVDYETSYGSLKFWEKILKARVFRSKGEVDVVSPYMTNWIFPDKKFLEQSLINDPHSFGDKDQPYRGSGMFEEENDLANQSKISEIVNRMINNYGNGKENISVRLNFIDYEINKTIISMPILLSRNDISMDTNNMTQNVIVNADFNRLYDIIEKVQKENQQYFVNYPSWDKSVHFMDGLRGIVNAVEVWFKMKGIINNLQVSPTSARSDVISFANSFVSMAMGGK